MRIQKGINVCRGQDGIDHSSKLHLILESALLRQCLIPMVNAFGNYNDLKGLLYVNIHIDGSSRHRAICGIGRVGLVGDGNRCRVQFVDGGGW